MIAGFVAAGMLLANPYQAEDRDTQPATDALRFESARQLIAAVRNRDRAGFARRVWPGARADGKRRFSMATLAPFADRCETSLARPWTGEPVIIVYWLCPGGEPAVNSRIVYRGERVIAVSTRPTPRISVQIPCGQDIAAPCRGER